MLIKMESGTGGVSKPIIWEQGTTTTVNGNKTITFQNITELKGFVFNASAYAGCCGSAHYDNDTQQWDYSDKPTSVNYALNATDNSIDIHWNGGVNIQYYGIGF